MKTIDVTQGVCVLVSRHYLLSDFAEVIYTDSLFEDQLVYNLIPKLGTAQYYRISIKIGLAKFKLTGVEADL